jgi:hypothetical protein
MPTQVQIFPSITIPVPRDAIYRRLGYRKGTTKIDDRRGEEIERHIDYGLSLISLKGVGRRATLKELTPDRVVLGTGVEIASEKLARFLKGCTEVLLIGATAGGAAMEAIRGDTERGDMTRSVVVDAVASEMTDAALDWIIGYFNRLLTREQSRLTRGRFSAGYGDFLLENQRVIYDLLELDRIGVAINENCILIPEKSVTAVAGIQG